MPKLFICVDPGGSQTKIIYQLPKDEKPIYFLMPPEVEKISSNNLKRYLDKESKMSNPSAVRQAYLVVNKQTFVVGHFASKFDPEDRLSEIKYENALYKTLATVGIIVDQNDLNPKKVSLQLAVLLPWNEYEDRQKFYGKLKEYLNNFNFRGKPYSVQLDRFICRPEGGGLAAIHNKKKGSRWQQDKKLGILMFGHRNITALCFEYGELTGDSPLIGFSKLLDNVVGRTSGLDRERIASAVFRGLESDKTDSYRSTELAQHNSYPSWNKLDAISELANAKDKDLQQQEIKDVCQAIEAATEEYWTTVSKWLDRVFPEDLDSVVISGGASRFLKPDLEKYFNCQYEYKYKDGSYPRQTYSRLPEYCSDNRSKHFTPIVWGAGFVSETKEILALSGKKEAEESLSYRLVDAYGLFDLLISKNQKKSKKASPKTVKEGSVA
ncbi:MAG: ParM/StbA family protein [Cyanobacteria bacterium J06582_2]